AFGDRPSDSGGGLRPSAFGPRESMSGSEGRTPNTEGRPRLAIALPGYQRVRKRGSRGARTKGKESGYAVDNCGNSVRPLAARVYHRPLRRTDPHPAGGGGDRLPVPAAHRPAGCLARNSLTRKT